VAALDESGSECIDSSSGPPFSSETDDDDLVSGTIYGEGRKCSFKIMGCSGGEAMSSGDDRKYQAI
jgi:hypothetical protein